MILKIDSVEHMTRMRTIGASLLRALASAYPLILIAVVWEAVARAGLVRPVFLPPLSTVIAQLVPLAKDGEVVAPLAISLYRTAAGLAIAVTAGVCFGLLMARIRLVRWLLDPLIAFSFPSPKIAFLPVFILWFGIDHLSKIALVAFTCVFPFIVAAYAGATTVPTNQLWAARAMGTGNLPLLWRVILPASLPSLMSGLRVGVPYALVSTFTAEMIAGGGGLGSEMMLAQRYFETPTVFVYLLIMLAAGYLIDIGVLRLREHILRWHEE
jgi:ABC-type nitrate/sulfonate/bicarbonate transport system permease component